MRAFMHGSRMIAESSPAYLHLIEMSRRESAGELLATPLCAVLISLALQGPLDTYFMRLPGMMIKFIAARLDSIEMSRQERSDEPPDPSFWPQLLDIGTCQIRVCILSVV